LIFIAAFVVTGYVNSLPGSAASVFLGLGVLVAFVSWFQMRLEENERLKSSNWTSCQKARRLHAL